MAGMLDTLIIIEIKLLRQYLLDIAIVHKGIILPRYCVRISE